MDCFLCGHITNLTQSWRMETTVRRYRECPNCGNKFFTYEIPEEMLKTADQYVNRAAYD
jgi:transcriptional regulator NrdR family protein